MYLLNPSTLFLLILTVFCGCGGASGQRQLTVKETRPSEIRITILTNKAALTSLTDCLRTEINRKLPKIKILPEEKFRDALFPWFERTTAPKTEKELNELLNRPVITDAVKDTGVDYMILIDGIIAKQGVDGILLGLGLGMVGGSDYANLEVKIWDVQRQVSQQIAAVNAEGGFVIAWVVLPIPVKVQQSSLITACQESVNGLVEFFQKNSLSKTIE